MYVTATIPTNKLNASLFYVNCILEQSVKTAFKLVK